MKSFVRVAVIENEVQANFLEAVLNDRGIPHQFRSYHDLVYDGLFQNTKGWGHIDAPKEYEEEILEIISEINDANINEIE